MSTKLKNKKAKCFQCQTSFYIKFVIPRQAYSQKNNWSYWTGQSQDKKICDRCLWKKILNQKTNCLKWLI